MQKKNKVIQALSTNKKHINSSLFLFIINVFNFIFPLLLSPIIISRCGVEGFGIVMLFQSIMLFISSVTDYGFNINATREVTIKQNDNEFVNKHFFIVTFTKSLLLVFSLVLGLCLYFFFPKASEYSFLFFTSLSILAGRTFNPLWVLRAIHKMKFVFYFYLLFKVLSILTVYLFLKNDQNLYLVNLSIGISDLLTFGLATLVLFFNLKWKIYTPSVNQIKKEIYYGFAIFTQNLSINANAYLNPMILSFFVNSYSLGIYSVVEKIILVIKFCASFVQQSVFPKVCELNIENRLSFNKFMIRLQIFLVVSMIIATLLLNLFSDIIVSYFIKTNALECSKFLKFNSWIPLIVALNMVPYLNFMVHGIQKPVTYIIVSSVVLNLILNTILSKYYSIYGVSTGVYIVELFISISLWVVMIYKYPKYNFLKK